MTIDQEKLTKILKNTALSNLKTAQALIKSTEKLLHLQVEGIAQYFDEQEKILQQFNPNTLIQDIGEIQQKQGQQVVQTSKAALNIVSQMQKDLSQIIETQTKDFEEASQSVAASTLWPTLDSSAQFFQEMWRPFWKSLDQTANHFTQAPAAPSQRKKD